MRKKIFSTGLKRHKVTSYLQLHYFGDIFLPGSGQLMLLREAYPRQVEEPDEYDTVKVHAEFNIGDETDRKVDFSVSWTVVMILALCLLRIQFCRTVLLVYSFYYCYKITFYFQLTSLLISVISRLINNQRGILSSIGKFCSIDMLGGLASRLTLRLFIYSISVLRHA